MTCRICKRTSCTESFHSLKAQEEFDHKQGACIGDNTCEWCKEEWKSIARAAIDAAEGKEEEGEC